MASDHLSLSPLDLILTGSAIPKSFAMNTYEKQGRGECTYQSAINPLPNLHFAESQPLQHGAHRVPRIFTGGLQDSILQRCLL